VSDRLDGRFASLRATALAMLVPAALLLGVAACRPLDPASPPPGPDGGTPCSRSVAVAASDVVISAGACNPWCIHVPVGTSVYFINNDPTLYLFAADPPLSYEVQVPGHAGAVTLPLQAVGPVTWTAVQSPAATVTIYVE
jgi:hypothetical protein